ncbi:acyltransferase [Niabella sp. CC-SYL272]|uniref:acyltransferase family protein n=1 Tax=Niabella agricola TaxID=2891571 RepID=UPI001F3F4B89|nr:acyltransferase [Niabella agricola]MCF3107835.1 acyltransferase [Niabella agricola]
MEISDNRFTNSFDFLRLLGAVGVIYLHAYHLLHLQDDIGLDQILHRQLNLTVMMLGIFFTASGYLIARSVERSSSLKNYLWKRILRVQPLLTLVCLLTVFVLGPLFTEWSISAYFKSGSSWSYLRTIFPALGIQFQLPGVFERNIGERGVNGSLWTLIIEERVYLAMGLLFLIRRRRSQWFTAFVAVLNILYLLNHYKAGGFHFNVLDSYTTQYYVLFFNGALCYFLKIPFHRINSLLMISAVAIVYFLFRHTIEATLYLLPLLILLIGSRKTVFSGTAKWGDITYGLYVLSFPVQQMLIHLSQNSIRPPVLFVLTLAICIPLAYLSWHCLEKQFLKLRHLVQ